MGTAVKTSPITAAPTFTVAPNNEREDRRFYRVNALVSAAHLEPRYFLGSRSRRQSTGHLAERQFQANAGKIRAWA